MDLIRRCIYTYHDGDGQGSGNNTNAENNANNTDDVFGTNYSDRLQDDGTFSNSVNSSWEDKTQSVNSTKDQVNELGVISSVLDQIQSDFLGLSYEYSIETEAFLDSIDRVDTFDNTIGWEQNGNNITEFNNGFSTIEEGFDILDPGTWLDGFLPDTYYQDTKLGIYADIGFSLDRALGGSGVVGAKVGFGLGFAHNMFTGFQSIQSGINLLNAGYNLGFVVTATSAFDMYSSIVTAQALYGGYSNAISLAEISNFSSSGDLDSIIKEAETDYEEYQATKVSYVDDVFTSNIYDKMAGGILYNEVFSGGSLFSSQKVANTTFSVGEKFVLGSDVKRLNFPYHDYAGGDNKYPLAGDDNFNVIKFKRSQ